MYIVHIRTSESMSLCVCRLRNQGVCSSDASTARHRCVFSAFVFRLCISS